MKQKTISIIIPVYNEEANVPLVYQALVQIRANLPHYVFEYIFVDDGSSDHSALAIDALASRDPQVRGIEFSRNFGKEMATTAGLVEANGDAVIMIDADLQHPPRYIRDMVSAWEQGAEVVVGVRSSNMGEGIIKKWGSLLFYKIIGAISETDFEQGETDFRLVDRAVVDAFKRLPEHQRMTRSLINWLGFRRATVKFDAPARLHGVSPYSTIKLIHLALNSFLSHSLLPLRFAGYLGVLITFFSTLLGTAVILEKYILHDPLNWGVTGSAQLAILNVFLVGIVLASLGIIGLYVGSIHTEVLSRPLYVIRERRADHRLKIKDGR
jgi:glycosyltransferase involved in cell wall biosynthesis